MLKRILITATQRRQSTRPARLGALLAGAAILTACTGEQIAVDTGPTSSSSAPPESPGHGSRPLNVQEVNLGTASQLPLLRTKLPSHFEFPPAGEVTSLLTDPPGRVAVKMIRYLPYDRVTGFADQLIYFFGVDGRWRSLRMSELGLKDSRWAGPDTPWAGSVSPDGRYWMFPTAVRRPGARAPDAGPVAVMDLRSTQYRFYYPGGARRTANPDWTASHLLAFDWKKLGQNQRVLVDVKTGQRLRCEPDFAPRRRHMVYDERGNPFALEEPARASAGELRWASYTRRMAKVSSVPVPFASPRNAFDPVAISPDRIGFLMNGVRAEEGQPMTSRIAISDRSLELRAIPG